MTQPDFAPLFFTMTPEVGDGEDDGGVDSADKNNGVAGAPPSSEGLIGRKRRGSLARLRHAPGYVVIAKAPERQPAGRSRREGYQTPRARKLTPEQEKAIRALAGTGSLRSLAADFGVSHETVRAALRRGV